MKLTEIRAEVLRQHAQLRTMIQDLRRVAEQASNGAPLQEELRAGLVGLAGAVLQHNILEEKWLGDPASDADGSSPARTNALSEEHADEHEELYAALVGIGHTPIEFAGAGVTVLLDGILEHMAREEKAFPSDDVVRADQPDPRSADRSAS
jgi:hypothetical protein